MEKKQQVEWAEAQKIAISEDLVDVAKKQLKFLAIVDQHRCFYEGPVLDRAIFRYKNYWLPFLAKHTNSDVVIDGPLAVPLDCEWVWHCHRLNPLRYKSDCEEFFGRILDNKNVISSTVQGSPKKKTKEIWSRLYPNEPYELDLTNSVINNNFTMCSTEISNTKTTQYDLVDAVKRQSTFFYQVSRPSMNDDLFLEGAVARYKGFLHLIKRNKERSIRRFCVPTYDIDLIWHSHQLNPHSYCKDMVDTMGKVIQHDDTDSNRTKGQKLEDGFSGTTKQWEDTFGSRYWRAGAMYRNDAPFPVTTIPWKQESKSYTTHCEYPKIAQLSRKMVVEVLVEIVDVRNLPEDQKGNLFVLVSKKKPDSFFNTKKKLSILSESWEKQVASFQCEPSGELFLELMSHAPSSSRMARPAKTMGTSSIPFNYIMDTKSKLSVEEWFELESSFGTLDSNPICLRIGVSASVPTPTPHVLEIGRSHPLLRNACFLPLPGIIQQAKSWTCVTDEVGNEIISIHKRFGISPRLKKSLAFSSGFTSPNQINFEISIMHVWETKNAVGNNNLIMKKEIIGLVRSSGVVHVLAEFVGATWYLMGSNWSSQIKRTDSEDGYIFEFKAGEREVKLYRGRKLEYEAKSCRGHNIEHIFITAVEFSTENPYGKAVALIDLKLGIVKVNEDWFVLPGITLNILLSNILRKKGYNSLIANGNNPKTCNLMEDDEYDVNASEGTALGKVDADEEGNTFVLEKQVDMKQHLNVKNDGACVESGNIMNKDCGSGSGSIYGSACAVVCSYTCGYKCGGI